MSKESKNISKLLEEIIDIELNNDSTPMIIKTNYKVLDKILDGFKLGEFILIGSKVFMGCEKLLHSLAINISKSIPLLFISLRLNESFLTKQLISTIKGFETTQIENYEISNNEQLYLELIKNKIYDFGLFINDTNGYTLEEFKNLLKKHIVEHNVKVIIIDEIKFLNFSDKFSFNREMATLETCRVLKEVAIEFDICIIACTKINEEIESEQESIVERPKLEDLWKNGNLAQFADKIILTHRNRCSNNKIDIDENSTEKYSINLIIVKNTDGYLGEALLKEHKKYNYILNKDDFEDGEL